MDALSKKAVLYSLLASFIWAFLPIYISLLVGFSAWTTTGARIIFSFLLLMILAFLNKKLGEIKMILTNFDKLKWFLLSGFFIVFNWTLYAFAVTSGRVLEGSLGYFMYPLFSVLFGFIFFKERFNRLQTISIVLVFLAILYMLWFYGGFPWYGLLLALSFSLYGAARKKTAADPFLSLSLETIIALPSAALMIYFNANDFLISPNLTFFLSILSGPITVSALWFYIYAVKNLTYSFSGLIFYVSPFLQFIFAYVYFKEELDINKLVAFCIIWLAIAVYLLGTFFKPKHRL